MTKLGEAWRPRIAFYGYALLSVIAIVIAFACRHNNGACWIAALWGLTACQPWTMVLQSVWPDASFNVWNIGAMSVLNGGLLYLYGVLSSVADREA
jgi:hypothetical protein